MNEPEPALPVHIEVDEEVFINEIQDTLENSFFRKDSIQLGYALTQIEPVKNRELLIDYK